MSVNHIYVNIKYTKKEKGREKQIKSVEKKGRLSERQKQADIQREKEQ